MARRTDGMLLTTLDGAPAGATWTVDDEGEQWTVDDVEIGLNAWQHGGKRCGGDKCC